MFSKEVEVKKCDLQRKSLILPALIIFLASVFVSKFADILQNLNPSKTFAKLRRKILIRRLTS